MTRSFASAVLLAASLASITAHAQTAPPASLAQPPATPSASTVVLGTDFSYQGYLQKNGAAYSGTADFKFQLFDAVTGGVQVGSDVTMSGLAVSSGLFAVQLDFGSVFDGSKRWLAVYVKTAGDAGYTELTPRRPVSATPYAVRAIPPSIDTSGDRRVA